jgi:hypothetical protein
MPAVNQETPATAAASLCPRPRHGGDHWQQARSQCRCFRAAAVVHRLGLADAATVARLLGWSWNEAREALRDAAARPHLYHLHRPQRGRFAPLR